MGPVGVRERAELTVRLRAAGCVAAEEEAAEIWSAAGADEEAAAAMVARRETGEPLAWIIGRIDFGGVQISVAPGVYVPRWQTAALAAAALRRLPAGGTCLDLCTGSGAVPAYLRAKGASGRLLGTDVDPTAVACARSNGVEAIRCSLDTDVPSELEHRFDVLTAVVPYVPRSALPLLAPDVRLWEPPVALDGGPDGTQVLRQVAGLAPRWLRPGGWLLLEMGADQIGTLTDMAEGLGFDAVSVLADGDGDPCGFEARWASTSL